MKEVKQKEKLTDMKLDIDSQPWSLTLVPKYLIPRLMDLSDTNLLYVWKLDSRIELHPEGGLS